jgi:hypothetical protein
MRAMTAGGEPRVATLWEVEWEGQVLRCAVYRGREGLQLRLESATTTVLAEPFEMRPRSLARARRLRHSLTRRGWRDTAPQRADGPGTGGGIR